MIWQYWSQKGARFRLNVSTRKIQRELYRRSSRNPCLREEEYLRESAFSFVFRGEWNDLRTHIEKGLRCKPASNPAEKFAALRVVVESSGA